MRKQLSTSNLQIFKFHDTAEKQYCKSNPFKTSSIIVPQEKMLGLEVLFSHS